MIDTEAPPIGDAEDDARQSSINSNILDQTTLRNETITQKMIIDSRVYNSNISYSYIQNSRLFGSILTNCIVLNTVLFNTTAYNCSLKDTTLHNSEVFNGTYDNEHYIQLIARDDDYVVQGSQNNIEMMIFGTIGIIILILAIIVGGFLIAGFIIKRRKDRLLVRSAVMGDIRSW